MGRYNKNATTNLFYMCIDFIMCFCSFIASLLIYGDLTKFAEPEYLLLWLIFFFVYVMMAKNFKLYQTTTFFYLDRTLITITKAYMYTLFIMTVILYFISDSHIDFRYYVIHLPITYFGLLISAFLSRLITKSFNITVSVPRTLLVGPEVNYARFLHFMKRSNMNINLIGYIDKPGSKPSKNSLGSIDELEQIIHDNAIDQVFFQSLSEHDDSLSKYIDLCLSIGVTAKIVLLPYNVGGTQSYIYSVGTYPVITYHNVNLNIYSRALKRAVDIAGSLVGIILSSPIMLITAIAIKLDSKGPIIFKQTRMGRNGRKFHMYKFRSMCIDAEAKKQELMKQNKIEGGLMFKMEDDPRITRVGKIIRKTSIDELPQFFNVLKGDMSLVGTRPPTLDEVALYKTDQWRRLSIRPGITGMWQVSGRSSITDFDEVVKLDTSYIDNWNIFLDIKIMIKTVAQIFQRNKGAM